MTFSNKSLIDLVDNVFKLLKGPITYLYTCIPTQVYLLCETHKEMDEN